MAACLDKDGIWALWLQKGPLLKSKGTTPCTADGKGPAPRAHWYLSRTDAAPLTACLLWVQTRKWRAIRRESALPLMDGHRQTGPTGPFRAQNRNWPVSSAAFSFLRNLGWLVAPVCLEASEATKPTISAWSFRDYSLIHPPQFCGLSITGARTGRRRGCRGRRWHHVPCVGAIFPVCAFLYDDAHVRSSDVLASNVSCPGAGLIKRLLV